ncbi:uncharacterized protein SPPG_03924 [Spizellomyces punctatus DAOM BR117]|uniref:Uncharacterized protein n=1 Tax=Spizellomyces punctatus (strain DAOM BR117) TaxID=645134 RepID=A0A0L0HIC7_SPIPD|nr:uncharacterized protein SPPG_03924 [Spizellomyces punctatus DAOM BR117]KND00818.1 hypothetical protein SPPG_03924 [Spizellomyces punctatus DAOM BR117]|eukprot:XP_016608857.1 hypothetical protein SPPG_03924 [Spizellomyces punctatus DAOM BR117]
MRPLSVFTKPFSSKDKHPHANPITDGLDDATGKKSKKHRRLSKILHIGHKSKSKHERKPSTDSTEKEQISSITTDLLEVEIEHRNSREYIWAEQVRRLSSDISERTSSDGLVRSSLSDGDTTLVSSPSKGHSYRQSGPSDLSFADLKMEEHEVDVSGTSTPTYLRRRSSSIYTNGSTRTHVDDPDEEFVPLPKEPLDLSKGPQLKLDLWETYTPRSSSTEPTSYPFGFDTNRLSPTTPRSPSLRSDLSDAILESPNSAIEKLAALMGSIADEAYLGMPDAKRTSYTRSSPDANQFTMSRSIDLPTAAERHQSKSKLDLGRRRASRRRVDLNDDTACKEYERMLSKFERHFSQMQMV